MQLTEMAIEKLKSNRKCINRIAYEFDVHSASVERWLTANENDGDLTKMKAVTIISEETELTTKQILKK